MFSYANIAKLVQIQFTEDIFLACIVLQDPEDIADVYANAHIVAGNGLKVGGQGLLVAVKGKADQLPARIENRRTGVSARYVVVREEVYGEIHGRKGITEGIRIVVVVGLF